MLIRHSTRQRRKLYQFRLMHTNDVISMISSSKHVVKVQITELAEEISSHVQLTVPQQIHRKLAFVSIYVPFHMDQNQASRTRRCPSHLDCCLTRLCFG